MHERKALSAQYPGARIEDDRPPYDGSVQRAILAQFAANEAHTVGEIAAALSWDRERVYVWVKHLRRWGRLRPVGKIWTTKRRLAVVYERVAE
jgi:hypothetical protein